jgi:hypothetical protein
VSSYFEDGVVWRIEERRKKKVNSGDIQRNSLLDALISTLIAKWGYLPASTSLLGRGIGEHCGRSGAFSELRLRNYELSASKRNTCY